MAYASSLTRSAFIALCVVGCHPVCTAFGQSAPVELVCVDNDAIGYATFQSHNQKVVANSYGIFMTHLRRRNVEYTAQTWRLSRSTDRGRSFATVYEATHATNPPVIETDTDGNIIGSFTDSQGNNQATEHNSNVYFFKIKTAPGG
jgi:hypothetical protein